MYLGCTRNTSDYAILVNGENFPDALSASVLAKKYNAPILLTGSSSLDDTASNQLTRLKVKKVFIVGGKYWRQMEMFTRILTIIL